MLQIKIRNTTENSIPQKATTGSAGIDLCSSTGATLEPGEWKVIPTGLYMEIPKGYEGQIRPRSGLAAKRGVTVLNSPGTIDSDYRGEIGVILINHSKYSSFEISAGDRIAQMVFAKCEDIEFIESETFESTDRGEGGFGHTGV